jgi:16S rRNA (uracil1498-N3)-methyltransferase
MRKTRIFVATHLEEGSRIRLGAEARRYLAKVLRLEPGAIFVVFNGEGGEFEARVEKLERDGVEALVGAFANTDRESPLEITLVQGVLRGERMDFTIQKAVELGVRTIVPVITQRSVVRLDAARRARRLDHWRGVAIHASQQCGRTRVPAVSSACGLDEWLGENAGRGHQSGFVLTPEAARSLDEVETVSGPVALLIGPEGGLSDEEQALAVRSGMQALALGPRILRTETAALAAITALQLTWGDLSAASR